MKNSTLLDSMEKTKGQVKGHRHSNQQGTHLRSLCCVPLSTATSRGSRFGCVVLQSVASPPPLRPRGAWTNLGRRAPCQEPPGFRLLDRQRRLARITSCLDMLLSPLARQTQCHQRYTMQGTDSFLASAPFTWPIRCPS